MGHAVVSIYKRINTLIYCLYEPFITPIYPFVFFLFIIQNAPIRLLPNAIAIVY